MNERERRERARFWARLASVASLEDLSKPECEQLTEDYAKILEEENWGSATRRAGSPFSAAAMLKEPHKIARETLLPMIVEKRSAIVQIRPTYMWKIGPDGEFQEQFAANDIVTVSHNALARVLRGSKSLFMRCPECGSLFVRVKHQKYCSPNCTAKALENARRGEKAKYMRTYRKRQKAQKGG